MRAKGRKQGRFMALSGLTKLTAPPGSQYPLFIVDFDGSPVFFLCDWYRRKKAGDPGRTPDTYLEMVLPWGGFSCYVAVMPGMRSPIVYLPF